MKSRIKTFISIITAVLIIFSMAPFLTMFDMAPQAAFNVFAEDESGHTHDGTTFTEWNESSSLPAEEGAYFLTRDVTLSEPWEPTGYMRLCLNGHEVIYTGDGAAPVIRITGDNQLNLYDCKDSGRVTGGTNGGIYVAGRFVMYGGSVSGNSNDGGNGGGVIVDSSGTMLMNGGSITDNRAGNGGGIYNEGGVMTLGGAISSNTASGNGGGVYSAGKTTGLYDLAISGNTAAGSGGGVYAYSGELFVGSEITGNEAAENGGGVCAAGGKVTISADPVVTGNSNGNVYLPDRNVLYVGAKLTGEASVGISMETPGTFTSGYEEKENTGDPGAFFTSDDTRYDISRNGGEALLFLDGKYAVTVDSSITKGTVTADKRRAVEGEQVTLTITPDEGFVLDALTVTDADGGTVDTADDKFTMPAKDVTVTASFKPGEDFVYPESISLDKEELSLMTGRSATLTATVLPEDATDKTVTWASSDESVAKVDSNGKVTGVSPGTATVTAATAYGNKTAVCSVTVTELKYKVVFRDGYTEGDEGILKTEDVVPGGDATAPEDPVREGYDFNGWDKSYTNVQNDITVSAKWSSNDRIQYIDANENELTCEEYETITAETAELSSETSEWYAVKESVTVDRLTVKGNVNLILCDGATLTVRTGVVLDQGEALTVWCQSGKTGRLDTTGSDYQPGIGGWSNGVNAGRYGGTLTVNGGIINATGGYTAAGIGSGSRNDMSYSESAITYIQNGGTVTATAGRRYTYVSGAAGIGGSFNSGGGTVTVNGGSLKATGSGYGAGIGTSYANGNGQVTINGGRVEAIGGSDAGAGIGSYGGSVIITGGEVIATGNGGGAGIGGQGDYGQPVTGGGTLRVHGGTVTATSNGRGAAIGAGGGRADRGHGILEITGELKLEAGANAGQAELKTTDERVEAAHDSAYAKISPCEDHEYEYVITVTDHTATCKYCGKHEPTEEHVLNENNICVVCHAHIVYVDFDTNGGQDGGAMIREMLLEGTEYTIPACGFIPPEGQAFTHWSIGETKYNAGDKVTINEDTEIKANWDGFTWKTLQAWINNAADGTVITLPEEAGTLIAESDDTALTVPAGKSVTVDLNGWTLDRGLFNGGNSGDAKQDGNVITVKGEGNLTLKNGTVTGGNNTGGGGGITVEMSGRLSLNKVDIVRNNAENGGGIYNAGRTTMTGGRIVNNLATNGGGIYSGGGVSSSVRVTGATIEVNLAKGIGGGIYCAETVYLTDTAVTENTCAGTDHTYQIVYNGVGVTRNVVLQGGGIYVEDDDSSLHVEGKVTVTDNMCSGNNKENNVYLCDRGRERSSNPAELNALIRVDGKLSGDSSIGVTYEVPDPADVYTTFPVTITKGLKNGNGTADNFFADDPDYMIVLNSEGEAIFGKVTITVTHEAGEGTGEAFDAETLRGAGYVLPAKPEAFTAPEGKEFTGWLYNDKKYLDGETVPVSENVTVTALWGSPWQMLQEKINAAESGAVITLDRDYTAYENDEDLYIPGGKKITLDLNGHTLDRNMQSSGDTAITVGTADEDDGAELILKDSSSDGSGKITNADIGVAIFEGSSMTMEGGNVTGTASTGVSAGKETTFTMTGGKISGNEGNGVFISADAVMNVSGTPKVTGNKRNVNKPAGVPIHVNGALTADAEIGVTLRDPAVPTKDDPAIVLTDGFVRYTYRDVFTDDTGNYIIVDEKGEAVITMETASATVTANEGLVATGKAHELVTASDVTGGTVQYSREKDGPFSEEPITETEAGTYNVFYRIIGDETHLDVDVIGPVVVEIEEIRWSDPEYTWSETNSTVTASRTAENAPDVTEEETVATTSEVTKEPTCTEKGKTTYTSNAFRNEAFEVQTKTVDDIDALGHDFGEWQVVTPATETEAGREERTCSRCGEVEPRIIPARDHVHKMTHFDADPATCTSDGHIEYWRCDVDQTDEGGLPCYGLFADEGGNERLNPEDIVVHATGHDWSEPSYEWSEDNSTVTATRVCGNDSEHVEKEKATVTSEVTKEPTVEEEGVTTYTAAFSNPAFETQTRTEAIPKLEEFFYETTKGDGGSWTKGSSSGLEFVFERTLNDPETFSHFEGITVDGNEVDASNYEARSGSAVVDLKPEYLETLAVGEHTLTAVFDDGNDPSAGFTIVAAEDEGDDSGDGEDVQPADGDDSGEAGDGGDGQGEEASGGSGASGNKSPETGDTSRWTLWAVLAVLAAGGLFAVLKLRSRDKDTK